MYPDLICGTTRIPGLIRCPRSTKEGRLPLEAGALRPVAASEMDQAGKRVASEMPIDEDFNTIQQDVLQGNHEAIINHVQEMLDKGFNPKDI